MKIEVQMPKMGESLQEGTILKWLKNIGDAVERDEIILEISTDKVDTEIPSPASGILTKIFFGENDTVEVGTIIAEIESDAVAAESSVILEKKVSQDAKEMPPPEKETPVAEPTKAIEVITPERNIIDVVMPKMGESLQEGTILKWLKNIGDAVERDELILEISTDKVDTEVPSPAAGILIEILAQENETIEVGNIIARIATGEVTINAQAPIAEKIQPIATPSKEIQIDETRAIAEIPRQDGVRFYSPLVRSIAETEGITLLELRSIAGSGVDGRVTKEDLMKYLESRKMKPAPSAIVKQAPAAITVKEFPKPPAERSIKSVTPIGTDDEIIPMDRVRRIIAEHMVYSKRTSAHVTSVGEADVSGIVKIREKYKEHFEKEEGFKLTYTPFFAKAIIDGVKAFPMVNVSVDGNNIIRHKRINLGIATALDNGNLIVPVIKDSGMLNITGLARAVYDLSHRARIKKLNPDDIQGGTISVTNVGTFGTLFGSPIINQPECAIIGIGAIQKRPVVREFDGENLIVIREMCYISITYDHRVIDGMLAGQCLAAIIESAEGMNVESMSL